MKKRLFCLVLSLAITIGFLPAGSLAQAAAASLPAAAASVENAEAAAADHGEAVPPETAVSAPEPEEAAPAGEAAAEAPVLYAAAPQAAPAAAGDFTVTGGTAGADYSYSSGVLTVLTDTALTIENTVKATATADRIEVTSANGADITLAGVNIAETADSTCAFRITGAAGAVTLTLADGSANTLTSGRNCAGLQKENSALLNIRGGTAGSGALTANGGDGGAGIGGGFSRSGSGITVSGGTVTANGGLGGAGIGGGSAGSGIGITVSGGAVTANGGSGGAGIGGGCFCSGSDITVSGGTVNANGGSEFTDTINGWAVGKGEGIGGGGEYWYNGTVQSPAGSSSGIVITGGSIRVSSMGATPTNGTANGGEDLSLYTLTLSGVTAATAVTSLELTPALPYTYGMKDVSTDAGGRLYVWLPDGKTAAACDTGDMIFTGAVSAGGGTLQPPLTVTGGTKGTDYTYAGHTVTVLTDTALTIENTVKTAATTDRIEVTSTNGADITLAGVNIAETADFTCAFRITNKAGAVTLTLADGSANTLTSGQYCAGLQKENSALLNIQGGTAGSGALTANGGENGAGIGGGLNRSGSGITVSGGTVTAIGGLWGAGIGGGGGSGSDITVSGGAVTANGGGGGAGIGGGYLGSGSDITVSGGAVTANGGTNGAGIGGGSQGSGSGITVSGGAVTANGGYGGAGIGGGLIGSGSDITVSGGTVNANGGSEFTDTISGWAVGKGEGIGGGGEFRSNGSVIHPAGSSSGIVITGGSVWVSSMGGATPTNGTANGGEDLSLYTLTLSGVTAATAVPALELTPALPYTYGMKDVSTDAGGRLYVWLPGAPTKATCAAAALVYAGSITNRAGTLAVTEALVVTGGTKDTDYTYSGGVLTVSSGTALTIQNRFKEVPATDRIEVTSASGANITLAGVNIAETADGTCAFRITGAAGAVTLTLADGSANTLTSGRNCAGLQKENSALLNIQGGTAGSGALTANGGKYGAGIGGGNNGNGSDITVSGGTVTANGGKYGAGIGGGDGGSGSGITVSGGAVTATGGDYGAGIGGGHGGSGSGITVSGGTVNANGGEAGAGIGGGSGGNGSGITVSGGTVTANGGSGGAGIGGGNNGSGSGITVSGGTVNANGGSEFTDTISGWAVGKGEGIGGGGEYWYNGTVQSPAGSSSGIVITGGSIRASSMGATPTNGRANVYRATLTVPGSTATGTAVNGLTAGSYGTRDIFTLDTDKVYLWLPENAADTNTEALLGGVMYTAAVTRDGLAEFERAKQYLSFASAAVTKTFGDAAFANKLTIGHDKAGSAPGGVTGTVTYASSDSSVAAVDANGLVTVKKAGTAVISASAEASAAYLAGGPVSYTLTVNARTVTPEVSVPDQVYAGSKLTPKVTVKAGDTVLTEGTDYTVTWSGNDGPGTGSYTVQAVKGGSYAFDDVSGSFRILTPVLTNSEYGVTVTAADGTGFVYGTELVVKPVTDAAALAKYNAAIAKAKANGKIIVLYDISLMLNGSKVQPDGDVTVSITLTDEQVKNFSDLCLFTIDGDGNLTEITGTLNGNVLSFVTDHFSLYAIAGSEKVSPVTGDSLQPTVWLAAGLLSLGALAAVLKRRKSRRNAESD